VGHHSSDFLQLPPISELDILKVINPLRPSKSFGHDGTPGFIIKSCSTIFAPLSNMFATLDCHGNTLQCSGGKKRLLCLFWKKGNSSSVSSYRPISLLNDVSKVFEFVTYDHMLHYFKHKLNISQHGFSKAISTTTNFITYLNFISLKLIVFIFDLSSAVDLVSHPIFTSQNFLLMRFQTVTWTGFVVTLLIGNLLYALNTFCYISKSFRGSHKDLF
jgi:hypothetical protein